MKKNDIIKTIQLTLSTEGLNLDNVIEKTKSYSKKTKPELMMILKAMRVSISN